MTLIKREDTIEAIKKEIQDFEANYMHGEDDEEYGHDIGFVAGLHRAKTFIRSLPSAEAEWIPCSERLPSDDEYVIVSVLDDHGDTPWKYTTVAWLCNGVWISDNEILFGDVIAWMPLPKPYREDGEE